MCTTSCSIVMCIRVNWYTTEYVGLLCASLLMILQVLSVTELLTTVTTSELLHSGMIHQVASQMIRRQETFSIVRTRVREDTTMCTFMNLMPIFGFKAFMAEFALNAFQTCRNSMWQALLAIHRNALQTKITIY